MCGILWEFPRYEVMLFPHFPTTECSLTQQQHVQHAVCVNVCECERDSYHQASHTESDTSRVAVSCQTSCLTCSLTYTVSLYKFQSRQSKVIWPVILYNSRSAELCQLLLVPGYFSSPFSDYLKYCKNPLHVYPHVKINSTRWGVKYLPCTYKYVEHVTLYTWPNLL